MARKSTANKDKEVFREHCIESLDPILKLLRQQSSYSDYTFDVKTDTGKRVANSLCDVACLLPVLAGINDEFEDLGYNSAALGIWVEGRSKRTGAIYSWYFGLHGGVEFNTRFRSYQLILRCTDEFWETAAALGRCNGTLSYHENEVMTWGLKGNTPRGLTKPRSAILACIRDIVLATVNEDTSRQRDLGYLAVSWGLEMGAEEVLGGMEIAMSHFNKMNQMLHRLEYLNGKERARRAT